MNLFEANGGILNTTEAIKLGIHSRTLYALRDAAKLERLERGLYRLADAAPLGNADIVTVALKVIRGVICLISALAFSRMTTQIPHAVYLAIGANDQAPSLGYVLLPPSANSSGVSHVYLDPYAVIATAQRWLLDTAFCAFGRTIIRQNTGFSENPVAGGFNRGSRTGIILCPTSPIVTGDSIAPDPHARHSVYMSLQLYSSRWWCQFMESDLQTALPRTLNLATADEVIVLAARGGGSWNLRGRQALDLAIANERGGVNIGS